MDLKIINYSCPLIFFITLIYSYYAYIFEVCLWKFVYVDKRYNYVSGIFCFYHINFILILWSFFKIMIESDIEIPEKFQLSEKTIEKFVQLANDENFESASITSNTQLMSEIDDSKAPLRYKFNKRQKEFIENYCKKKGLKLMTRTPGGNINICLECKLIKPDRCHHCRKCNKCVLRMDHHCPYLNRCIGYTNQKYFLLFLIYLVINIIFILVTIMPSLIECWNYRFSNHHTEYHIFVLFIVSICAILPMSSLVIYTIRLISLNRTNIEEEFIHLTTQSSNIYTKMFDLGSCQKNFTEIFGKNIFLAILPVWTTMSNGYEYEKKVEV